MATDESEGTERPMAEERKVVTVMFADLAGFTTLSEQLDPEHVRRLVNAWFDCMVPVIERYGGTVDKFIGDEIMGLFGAPVAHENDPERGLRAALEMQEALAAFNLRQQARVGMHIGLNTGLVVAGGIGSGGQQRYSVMGDAVNLAARLKEAAEDGQILVGSDTYRMTAPLFDFRPLAPLFVKGKSGLVASYRLLGVRPIPGATRGIAGLRSQLVGRDAEMQRLAAAIECLAVGKGAVIAISGEPGLGKSRLVAESRQRYGSSARWAESRAQSYTQSASYGMVKNLLDNLLHVPPEAPAPDVAAALRSWTAALFPEGEQFSRLFPYLARLRGVALEPEVEEAMRHVLPEALQSRMRGAFAELLRAMCRLEPLVLVWEDLHWADPSSLGLLEDLLPITDEAPLLLVVVFRPQEGSAQEWYQRVVATRGNAAPTIELVPLGDADSERLVAQLLRIETLPQAMRELILRKAEGNPFFVEELLRSLIDAGVVLLEGGRAVATRTVDELRVPDTLQGVIAARVDRLPSEDKYTLQAAAVIGRVFQRPVLSYVLALDDTGNGLDRSLTDLQERELIRRRLEREYIFKHAVTQEVTYNSLLLSKRKELHRVTAEAIEALFPEQREELAPVLAHHYERAEAAPKAIHYLTLAADLDRRAHSNAEAIVFYRRALALARSDTDGGLDVPELDEKLGDVLILTGRQDDAREAFRDAMAQVQPTDVVRLARLRRKEGDTWIPKREFEEALRAYQLAETILEPELRASSPEAQREWLDVQMNRIHAHYWAHQVPEMAALVDRIRPLIEARGTPIQRSGFFRSVVTTAWRRDRFVVSDETLATAQAAVEAAVESGDLCQIAYSKLLLGMSHLWRREPDEGEPPLREGLELAERIGDAERQVLCLTYLTLASRLHRRIGPTRDLASRSMQAAADANMPFYVGSARANLAWAAWADGDPVEARAQGEAAIAAWGKVPIPNPGKPLALWPLAAAATVRGETAEAIGYLRQIVAPMMMRMPVQLERAVQDAIAAWDGGDAASARTLLTGSVELARRTSWL